MRSSEERVAAVKRRTAQLEAQRRWRRRRAAALGSAAACLLLIICLSFAMPGISARLAEGNYGIYGAVHNHRPAGVCAGRPGDRAVLQTEAFLQERRGERR